MDTYASPDPLDTDPYDPYDEWLADQERAVDDLTAALYPVPVESPTFIRQPDGSFAWGIDDIPF